MTRERSSQPTALPPIPETKLSKHSRGIPQPAHHDPVQGRLHCLLALAVQRRGGLVQQQDLPGFWAGCNPIGWGELAAWEVNVR